MMTDKLDTWLLKYVREQLANYQGKITAEKVAEIVKLSGKVLGVSDLLHLVDLIKAELTGMSVLQPLFEEQNITDIFVNGINNIWIDKGNGLEKISPNRIKIADEQQLRNLATRLISLGGRRLDDKNPCADVNLAHGIRVHAVLPPISKCGVLLSIRIPNRTNFSLEELVMLKTINPNIIPVLKGLIFARINFLVSGATGSGKTSFLNTLLGEICPTERIILIEDVTELHPKHPHSISLEARKNNLEGQGQIGLAVLLREALRMRPDRLVIGECRGSEIRELFSALNTGHSGGCGTIHANNTADVPARLEALGVLANMTPEAVNIQAKSAFDCVIHFKKNNSQRYLSEIAVFTDRNKLQTIPAWRIEDGNSNCQTGWLQLKHKLATGGFYL